MIINIALEILKMSQDAGIIVLTENSKEISYKRWETRKLKTVLIDAIATLQRYLSSG
jgi:hypothetical protein